VKLQTKILAPLLVSTALITAVVAFLLHSRLTRELLTLEREDHARSVGRVIRTIEDSHLKWADKMADWAMWDDAYEFIESRDPAFAASNGLISEQANTFEVVQMDMILFLNNDRETVLFAGQDYRRRTPLYAAPAGIRQFISQRPDMFLWKDLSEFRTGFLQSEDEVIQLVMRPITDSEGVRPSRGTMLYARFFRGSEIERIQKLTGYKIEANLMKPGSPVPWEGEFRIEPVSEDEIRGTAVIKDIFGREFFELSVSSKRAFYHQGLSSFGTVLLLFSILCLLLILGMSMTIDRLTIRRLKEIDRIVKELKDDANSGDLIDLARLGRDEIGRMSQEVGDLYLQVRLLADYDGLTSLHNARYFRNAMPQMFEMARRHQKPLSMLMFDVDHFKRINDTYGHLQGDKVLEHIGKVLKQVTRASDLVVRYGGEEFAAVLPESGAEGARLAAEKIREALSRAEIPSVIPGEAPLRVTVSLGVATLTPGCATGWELVQRADRALYTAKNSGRDRVVVADAAPEADGSGGTEGSPR
jgi:diguanylate cyclase (GGDEF)-like protein